MPGGVRPCLQEMLCEWRRQGKPLTDVIKAIQSQRINKPKIAEQLKGKWTEEGYCELVIKSGGSRKGGAKVWCTVSLDIFDVPHPLFG